MKKHIIIFVMAIFASMSAFAQSYGGSVYDGHGARSMSQVTLGTVYSVRQVTIEPPQQGYGVGSIIGGAVGAAIAASAARRANMVVQTAAVTAGGAIGVAAGQSVERRVSTVSGVEIVVKLQDGRLIALSQGADEAFRVGQQVMLVAGNTGVRLTAAPSGV